MDTDVNVVEADGDLGATGATCALAAANGLVECTIGTLPAGATPGPQTSTATVGSTVTPDSNGANDADSDVTTVVQADVAVSITDGPYDPVLAGGEVVFTVTVENAGPGGATSVESDVVLPAGLTLTNTSCGATLTCSVGSLAPGEQYVYTVTAAVDAGASGTLTTNAAVTTTSGESTLLNNAATEDTTVLPAGTPTVDLAVTSVVVTPAGALTAGDAAVHQYTTTVEHVSGVDATSVELVQDIPAGFVVQGTPTATVGGVPLAGSSCTVVGQQVTCQLGRRDAGSAPVVIVTDFVVAADTAATAAAVTTATVSAAEPETTLANNEATASSPVTVDSDVGIAVTDGVTTVVAGEGPVGRAYTVTVTNNGPSTATGVVWDGAFPGGQLTQGVVSGSGCSAVPCTLGTLAPGESRTITVAYQTRADATGPTVTYPVTVTSTSADSNSTNNGASDVNTLERQVDLATTVLRDSADPVAVGENFVYTVRVRNNGPSTATGATETVALDAGLTLVSTTCGMPSGSDCALPTLAAGEEYEYTVTVSTTGQTPPASFTTTATAVAGAGQTDTNPSNDARSETTNLVATTERADLRVSKADGVATVRPGDTGVYTVLVENLGPDAATNVTVRDTWPSAALTQGTVTATGGGVCTPTSTEVVCQFGSIAALSNATVTIGYTVDNPPGNTVTNVVEARSSDIPDPVPENNDALDSNSVFREVDLAVEVSDGQTTLLADGGDDDDGELHGGDAGSGLLFAGRWSRGAPDGRVGGQEGREAH
jgi:uncharacterized repeat protein (TIGR01451 family)